VSDRRRELVARAIAGGVDPARLPGLPATVDRVLDALDELDGAGRPDVEFRLSLHELALVTLALTRLAVMAAVELSELSPLPELARADAWQRAEEARALVARIADALPPLDPASMPTGRDLHARLAIDFDRNTVSE